MAANRDRRPNEQGENDEGHPAMTMSGVAPVKTTTKTWSTPHPNPDATSPSTMPKALRDEDEGENNPNEEGRVLDWAAADANQRGSNESEAS